MEINQAYESACSLVIHRPSTSYDVYAQVDKSRKTQNANVNDNVYAVVESPGSLGIQQPSTSNDVYAQVDKSRKLQNANDNDTIYADVDKTKKKDSDTTG